MNHSSPIHRILLIGYRGTGKTTVAQLLAERLGWPWADADAVLEERFQKTIRAIFAEEGEAGFRDKETLVLRDLCRLSHHVLATGGGIILREENRKLLKENGFVIWLRADPQTLWSRLQEDATTWTRRPNLAQGGIAEIEELLKIREPFYSACANQMVDTVGRTPEEVVETILATDKILTRENGPRTTDS